MNKIISLSGVECIRPFEAYITGLNRPYVPIGLKGVKAVRDDGMEIFWPGDLVGDYTDFYTFNVPEDHLKECEMDDALKKFSSEAIDRLHRFVSGEEWKFQPRLVPRDGTWTFDYESLR